MNLISLVYIEALTTLSRQQSLHEPRWGLFTWHSNQCYLHFDKPKIFMSSTHIGVPQEAQRIESIVALSRHRVFLSFPSQIRGEE